MPLDNLMQRALTVRNNEAPSSNTNVLVGGVLVSIVIVLETLFNSKQDTLTFDTEPTEGSGNPVTSDGIYNAIAQAIGSIDLSTCEKIVNKVTAIDQDSTDVQYPTAKLLYDSLQVVDAYLNNLDARVTSLENDPPVTYTIRGTSSNIGGTETFRARFIAKGASAPAAYQNITVNVDAYGVWQIKYVNKYIYALDSFASNKTSLLTIDFSNADDLAHLSTMQAAFDNCSQLVSVDIHSRYLNAVTEASFCFRNCIALTHIDLNSAIFAIISPFSFSYLTTEC